MRGLHYRDKQSGAWILTTGLIFMLGIQLNTVRAAVTTAANPPASPEYQDLKLSGQWFLGYQNGWNAGKHYRLFLVKRGSIAVLKQFGERISGRITYDITVDRDGDGEGDIEMRLKHCFLKAGARQLAFFNQPALEFGLVHRPWLSFEEHINRYRAEGEMFLERSGIVNSADFGITFSALLGEPITAASRRGAITGYPGKWGSLAVGLYNGGGYHALEKNRNKTVEGRLTLRPMPSTLAGFQSSLHGAYGKGNTPAAPKWWLRSLCLTFQNQRLVGQAMVVDGCGNYKGNLVDTNGVSLLFQSYSLFTEVRFPKINSSLFARWDMLRFADQDSYPRQIWQIAGVAYHFAEKCKLIIDYDREWASGQGGVDRKYELVVEVGY